jgi:hypothetical protein
MVLPHISRRKQSEGVYAAVLSALLLNSAPLRHHARADLILHSPGYAVAERARREAPRGRLWAAASNR